MARFAFANPFVLQLRNGSSLHLHAGDDVYVPDEHADHPDIQAAAERARFPSESAAPSSDGDNGDERGDLLKQAEELGLAVDKRWGNARLKAAIDEALAK